MQGKEVIRVDHLSFTYTNAANQALDDVSFSVYEHEVVGIIGHTGAGKSTLGYCLRGLVPDSIPGRMKGEILIDGQSVRKMDLEQKARHFGIVFQDPESQIIGSMVLEDITFGMANLEMEQGEMLRAADEMLHRLDLYEKRHFETATLSGGQKQRLSIGGVLGMQPDIIYLDEPTTELDPVGKAEVFAMIRALKDSGSVTVMLVSHQTELLAEIADRILVFQNGRLLCEGPPMEIFGDIELIRSVHERVPQEIELVHRLAAESGLDYKKLASNRIDCVADYIHAYYLSGDCQ